MNLELRPISLRDANAYIEQNHRHHGKTQGHKFSIACYKGETLVGVVVVGRPVARMLDDGTTAEVTRLCSDGTPHVPSKLYAAAWRAARAMGYRRLITYILDSEDGTSVRAAGWRLVGEAGGGSWSRSSRPRHDKAPLGRKKLYATGGKR